MRRECRERHSRHRELATSTCIKARAWRTCLSGSLKPRSHLADLTADLSRPWWSGEVLWSRRKVGKERGWVLEGPGRSVNLVEVSPTVPGCFELFKTIGSGREWRAVVDRALGSRVRSLEGRWVSVNKPAKDVHGREGTRTAIGTDQPRLNNVFITTH